jgi:hypothetical protein
MPLVKGVRCPRASGTGLATSDLLHRGHFRLCRPIGRKNLDMQPRAIETRYKGYRFRSRLEARWAVFFDALGLKWEYEPEGFELGNFQRYLPDFKVWGVGFKQFMWVEIKGEFPSDTETAKLAAVCGSTEEWGLILFGGMSEPDFRLISKHGHDETDSGSVASIAEAMCIGWWQFDTGLAAARSARFEHGENGAAR